MHRDVEEHLESVLHRLRASWSLMLAASLAWAGLGLYASPAVSLSEAAPPATSITAAITVLGVLSAVATLWIDRMVITTKRMAALMPAPDHTLVLRHLFVAHLVLWSFAGLPALLGFAQLLLDGSLGAHLTLCAVSLTILALLMPTRARITARMEAVLH